MFEKYCILLSVSLCIYNVKGSENITGSGDGNSSSFNGTTAKNQDTEDIFNFDKSSTDGIFTSFGYSFFDEIEPKDTKLDGKNINQYNDLYNKLDTLEKNIMKTIQENNIELEMLAMLIRIENLEKQMEAVLNLEKDMRKEIRGITKLRCKEQNVTGYNMKSLYLMANKKHNHIRTIKHETFKMHIAIKAERDAVIILSDINEVDNYSSVYYEIVVGAKYNEHTELRKRKQTVVSVNTSFILCDSNYEVFYIKIADGLLEFGEEGSSSPIISYKDSDFNKLEYFGFASGIENGGSNGDVDATFLYDCPEF